MKFLVIYILSELVAVDSHIVSVDIDCSLVKEAKVNLTAAGFEAVEGECPPERLADANEQLGALLGWTIFGRILPPHVKAEFDDPDVALPVTIGGITADDCLTIKTLLNGRSVEGECNIAELAYAWRLLDEGKRGRFPSSTILRAWKDRPTPVDPERRPTKILAEPLRYARPTQGILPIKGLDVPVLGQQPGRQAALPGLEQTPGAVVPVLPLHIAEYSKAGRGAAITPRLWFGFQMALPREIRDGREARLNFTLRELVSWLWPNGWHRNRDLPRLAQGLHDLNQLGIVYERVKWLLVRPVKTPTWETRLDDSLRVDVTSLPGSDRGPMIDTVRLWRLGAMAGVPWRAWIRLAYLWDAAKRDNGGFRIYATRPEVLRGPDGVILNTAGNTVATPGRQTGHELEPSQRRPHGAAGAQPAGRPPAHPRQPRPVTPGLRRQRSESRNPAGTCNRDAELASGNGKPGRGGPGMEGRKRASAGTLARGRRWRRHTDTAQPGKC